MAEVNMVTALTMAHACAMEADPAVVLIGEDIGVNGGVFRVTDGLLARFGPERVLDTPIAEAMLAGVAVGMATQGLKPVVEIQFMGFIYCVIDQLINHGARMRNRTRGRLTCPMVVRAPTGAGIHAPEHHGECTEAMLAHIPGLRVLVASSPRRAYGLLLAAIADPDPVVFLEPTRYYRAAREVVEDDGVSLPLDTAFVLREGHDLTFVTWGSTVRETLAVADRLAGEGVSAEVIDVACLRPLDEATILASVEKTGRCVIVHEATLTGGFGGEIAARIAHGALFSLLAPIERVAAPDVIVPLARMERIYMPGEAQIHAAAQKVLAP